MIVLDVGGSVDSSAEYPTTMTGNSTSQDVIDEVQLIESGRPSLEWSKIKGGI